MILLTRFPKGDPLALNPDLVERAEAIPETVLTMTDGSHYMVRESVAELTGIIKHYRASILAMAQNLAVAPVEPAPGSLRLVREGGHEVVDEKPPGKGRP